MPQVWAAEILETLADAHVFANIVNRDYEGDIREAGDTVRINSIGDITITAYTRNTTNLTPQFLDGAGQTMVIDQANQFNFAIDDLDKAQIKGAVMQAAIRRASWRLAETVDTDLASVIQASIPTGSGNTLAPRTIGTGAGDEDAFELLVDLRVLMDENNTPKNDRWCVITPRFVGALLKDPRFTSFGTTANLSKAMSGDFMETLVGMRLYVSNNTVASGSARYITAGYKGAATYAEAIKEGTPEAYRVQGGFSDAVKGLHLYGRKVTRPANLAQCLVTFS